MTLNGRLQIVCFLTAVSAVTPLVGGYMARVFGRQRTWLDPIVRPGERLPPEPALTSSMACDGRSTRRRC